MATKKELKKALEALSFWACCFDYKNYSGPRPLYGGRKGCRDAKDLIEEFIEETIKE